MPSQRVLLGIGLAVLLIISAASIGLDVKSRSDAERVNHTLGVQKKISDLRLLVRRAESVARGFVLASDPNFIREYREAVDRIAPAFAELKELTKDNPAQIDVLDATEPLVRRRLAVTDELVRLQSANDKAGIDALLGRREGRSLMETVNANFDRLSAEEERLLAIRAARSQRSGQILLAIDLCGAALIVLLAGLLIRGAGRERRQLTTSLSASQAANEALEAAVAERTAHLVAAHEELRSSIAVLQSTFTSMAEAVLVIDTTGEVLLSNPAAERMLRYRSGMNVSNLQSLSTVFRSDGSTPITPNEMPSARALRGEEFNEMEILVQPASGRDPVHLVISGRPLRDAAGTVAGAALVYHDSTASRETERKLQQAQKLDAIGKLTGGVAHDFNNMLTVITGTSETLVDGLKDRPDLLAVARLIDDAAQRSADLVKHLLAFARKQPLQPRDIDVNETVADIAKLLRPTLGQQIEIRTALAKQELAAHIDPSQLANSILNMAINARDAMPNGGKLLLETESVVLDEAYAQANPDVRPGPYVMLAVSDTGSGMPQVVLEKAFDPFFTTKEAGKGSGLGLSMVYGFVKQSDGHIKIYSEPGHGTTIRLYLPPAHARPEHVPLAAAPVTGGSETILVVEDDAMVRNFVAAQLQSLGYKTIAAADGRSALALLDKGEQFDLLFTDVIMPGGMSGRDLAQTVTRLRPGTAVLYTSGYTDNAIVHHGRLDEGVLLLAKPYRKPELARMVRLALQAGRTG